MDFENFSDSFCPILSAGTGSPCKCMKNCQWYNPSTTSCDINTIADILLHDPDAMTLRVQNDLQTLSD